MRKKPAPAASSATLPPAPYETAPARSDAIYVVRVGPIATEQEGLIDGYLAVRPDGTIGLAEVAASPMTALAAIAAWARSNGQRVECAPELGVAGRRAGMVAAEAPRTALEAALSFSLASAIPPAIGELTVAPQDAVELGRLARELHEAAPWRHWPGDSAFDVRLHAPDGATERFIANLMGNEVFGFALNQAETFWAIAAGTARPEDVTGISLTLDTWNDAAVNAFRAAFGIAFFPMPGRAEDGRLVPAGKEDIFKLIAVARAIVQLTPAHTVARGELVFDNGRMFADVTAPDAPKKRAPAKKKRAAKRKPKKPRRVLH